MLLPLRMFEACGGSLTTPVTTTTELRSLLAAALCSQETIPQTLFARPVALLVAGEALFLVMVCLKWTAHEGYRAGSLLPIAALLVTPAFGASGAFCVLWLPLYFLTGGRASVLAAARARGPTLPELTNQDAIDSTVALLLLTVCLGPLLVAEESRWALLAAAALLPVIVTLLWHPLSVPARARTVPRIDPSLLVLFLMSAALGLAWRVFGYLVLAGDQKAREDLFALLTKGGIASSTPNMVMQYFLIEAVGLSVSFAYFALLEDGPPAALGVMGGALALGPAPGVALYLAYRERRINDAMEKVQGTAERE